MSKKKTADQLRTQAIREAHKHYAVEITLGNILALEKQIRNGKSLWIGSISHTYTTHLVQLNGMVIVTIYDKKRNCIDCIMPYAVVRSWLDLKDVNEYIFREWRRTWQTN